MRQAFASGALFIFKRVELATSAVVRFKEIQTVPAYRKECIADKQDHQRAALSEIAAQRREKPTQNGRYDQHCSDRKRADRDIYRDRCFGRAAWFYNSYFYCGFHKGTI